MKTTMNTDIHDAFLEKEGKYQDLVWYARSKPQDDPYWNKVLWKVQETAFKEQNRIMAMYSREVDALKNPFKSDWEHGFNSGCLAAFRFVLTALDEETWTDEDGDELPCGGLCAAEEFFPSLDT